jgi:hypothetical protein
MEKSLFEILIKFDIPIFFIITKTNYNPDIKSKDEELEMERNNARKKIKNNINCLIKNSFKNDKTKKDEDAKNFIDKYTKIFFVNLVRKSNNPIFGIDKVLSSFSKLVPEKDWNDLKSACNENDEEKCIALLKRNLFLKHFSELDNLNKKSQEEAQRYLKKLKIGAIFTGLVPGVDIGSEYLYKYLFKEKLKYLYGFDYSDAEKATNKKKEKKEMKKNSISGEDTSQTQDQKANDVEENIPFINEEKIEPDETKNLNIRKQEEKIESKIDNKIDNSVKNVTSTLGRGLIEGVTVTLKLGASVGLKVFGWALLPITCGPFAYWSYSKVEKDCKKILKIFQDAFTPLKFITLLNYAESIKKSLGHLENLGKKLVEDNKKKEENKIISKEN